MNAATIARVARMLPAEPLLRLCALRWPDATDIELARALGVNRQSLIRWRAGARIDPWRADTIAIRLDLHPCDVWGPAWLEIPDLTSKECGWT